MYHSFLIHSSADGHLGCFHVLAITNNAAMNTRVHESFSIMVFSGYMPSSSRRKWQPTPVLLPGKFHGWKNLTGYSPWGRKESDMTERLHSLCLVVGLLGNMVFLFLVFKEISIQFSSDCIDLHSHQLCTSCEGSLFFIPSPAFSICRFFFFWSDWYEVIPHCS